MIYAVIMAGGSGTRFWPESRKIKPKQLLRIAADKTMIRATVERIRPAIPFERVMVITAADHAEEIRHELPELNQGMIVDEPEARNTAPCIALAAYKLLKMDPAAVMVVLPADHLIEKEQEFVQALQTACAAAVAGEHLLTFGIVPDRPETGYGYIRKGRREFHVDSVEILRVAGFVEKPDRTRAEEYLRSGQYLWNSGMFVWRVSTIVSAFERYLPAIARVMGRILPALNTPAEASAIAEAYAAIDPISIDYGIMEKAENVLTIPIDVGWNDVGSWASLLDVWDRDESGNATKGDVLILDSSRCVVSSPGKVATLIGVEDLIVVDTPDALMVCRKDCAQDVRRLHAMLKERGYGHLL